MSRSESYAATDPDPVPLGSVWVDQAIDNLVAALNTYPASDEQVTKLYFLWAHQITNERLLSK